MHFQFTFKQLEQRECIRSTARKARNDLVVVEAADFLHVAFHYCVTQCGLTITGDYHVAVTAYAYYCCHEQTPWLLMLNCGPVRRTGHNASIDGGDFEGFNPGGESNAVCMARHLQTVNGAVGIFFTFHRPDNHAIPAVIGGNFGVKAFKCQLSADAFCLLSAFE